MGKRPQEYFVRCASGFEDILIRELKGIGCKRVRPQVGGVALFGSLRDAYRACLWSRVATRVQLMLARVPAEDADQLYEGIHALAWEDLVRPGATIAVRAHGTNAALRNTQFTAVRVKDALCDRLREVRGARPDVDAKDPDFSLDVSLHERKATIYLNLSGASLHRRGYREDGVQTEAPMKETLAAGMLLAAGWDELAAQGAWFVDPMCGSGTLAIEAALIAYDIAPGSFRDHWGFAGWLGRDAQLWRDLVDEAAARADAGRASHARIIAGDLDGSAVGIARANARRARVGARIEFACADAAALGTRLAGYGSVSPRGLMAVNPPYGRRLQSADELPKTYEALLTAVKALPDGWRLAIVTPDAGVDTALGQTPEAVMSCYNGAIRASIHLYTLAQEQRLELRTLSLSGAERMVLVSEANSAQFAARLRKNAKQRAKWARKAGVGSYRVYDADLPDYAVSVDVFAGAGVDAGTTFVRIGEYPAPASVDPHRAARRLADVSALVPAVLDVDRSAVHTVTGRAEHDARGNVEKAVTTMACVSCGPHRVEIDLTSRHGIGFPLDYRPVYELLGARAAGKRVACLFANAGLATTYAAAGGAVSTVTVDPSAGFLGWAERTVTANGFAGHRNRFVAEDVEAWLVREQRAARSYDLIFCDVPAAYVGSSWRQEERDDQRFAGLLDALTAVLSTGGTLMLASTQRALPLDRDELSDRGLAREDVSARTIPRDFARTPKVHCCYLVTRP